MILPWSKKISLRVRASVSSNKEEMLERIRN
jgi:hypothetical protein